MVSVSFASSMREISKATSSNCRSGISAFVCRRIVIAYWLIPAEPARGFFQGVINDLARRYDAPLFEPHLSLLYKKMPAIARRELAYSIKVPFSEVIFDALKAVRCISPTQSRADVEAWRVVMVTELFAL